MNIRRSAAGDIRQVYDIADFYIPRAYLALDDLCFCLAFMSTILDFNSNVIAH